MVGASPKSLRSTFNRVLSLREVCVLTHFVVPPNHAAGRAPSAFDLDCKRQGFGQQGAVIVARIYSVLPLEFILSPFSRPFRLIHYQRAKGFFLFTPLCGRRKSFQTWPRSWLSYASASLWAWLAHQAFPSRRNSWARLVRIRLFFVLYFPYGLTFSVFP